MKPVVARHPTGPLPDSYEPTARRLFPTAELVEGYGPYATVISFYGRTFITLWLSVDDALDAKLTLTKTVASAPGFNASVTVHDLRLFVEAEEAGGPDR